MSSIAEVFSELFYGSGIWLGLLLILAITLGISLKTRYGSILTLPVLIFMGINYLTEGSGTQLWAAIVMFFASIFTVVQLMKDR